MKLGISKLNDLTAVKDKAENIESDESLPINMVSFYLDKLVLAVGKATSWVWLILLAVVLVNVFSRFVLKSGSIALQELSWHLFGITMFMSFSYAVVMDKHVRVDVARERFSVNKKAWIDLLGITFLLLPILWLMIDSLLVYAWNAFIHGERSNAPSGLPYRFIIKGFLPLGLCLVALAVISRALKCCTQIFGFPQPYIRTPTDGNN